MEAIRPKELSGTTTKVKTGCGNLYLVLNTDDKGQPVEAFITIGKAGGCVASLTEGIARLINIALKHGASIPEIVNELEGVNCHRATENIVSCVDGISKCLRAE